ncbi:hypothetical protein GYH30_014118 [Glycine max]|nr:hypothetical protein GYH30_014118 [Glycine max]
MRWLASPMTIQKTVAVHVDDNGNGCGPKVVDALLMRIVACGAVVVIKHCIEIKSYGGGL